MQAAGTASSAGLIPDPSSLRRCLVVGSGVAGLQVARMLLKLNLEVLVLEASHDVGGVWMQNYVGYNLQVPWRMYQFPEFLWPKHLQPTQEYPNGKQVQEYIRAYVAHFGLMRHIRLNCKLLRLRWNTDTRTWDALYSDTVMEKFFKVSVDFVVMCSGIYNTPFIPTYPGSDAFQGTALHARDFTDLGIVRGRRVLVVGSGKTALDCVSGTVSSRCAASVTMLYRQAHWPVPRSLCGLSIRSLLFNRAMAGMLPPYYTASTGTRVAEVVARPIKRLFWRGLENLIARKFRITKKLKPHVRLPTDLFYGGQILDDRVDEHLKSKELTMIRGEINCFVRNGVILQDGSFLPVDVILYCTGYDKKYDYLSGDMHARLGLQKDGLYLYRNILPPAVPHLAFVGSEVSTYNNILTHGLQALWLAHVLSGHLKLPHPAVMDEDIRAQQRWRRDVMPPQRLRGSVLALYMAQYHDQLLSDISVSPRRKAAKQCNPLAECFGAYSAEDYCDVLQERMRPATAAPATVEVPEVQSPQHQAQRHAQQQHHDDQGQSEAGFDELTAQYDELIAAALRVSEQQLGSEGNASGLFDMVADEPANSGTGGRRGLAARLESLGVAIGTESGYTNSSGASVWGPRSYRVRPSSLGGSAAGLNSEPGGGHGNDAAGDMTHQETVSLRCVRAAAAAAAAAAVAAGEAHRTRELSERSMVIAAMVAAARAAALVAYNAATAASISQHPSGIRPVVSVPSPRGALDTRQHMPGVRCRRSSTEPIPAVATRPRSASDELFNSAPQTLPLFPSVKAEGPAASSVGMVSGRSLLPVRAYEMDTSIPSPFVAPGAPSPTDSSRGGCRNGTEGAARTCAPAASPVQPPSPPNMTSKTDGVLSSGNAPETGFCNGDLCRLYPPNNRRDRCPLNGATAGPVLQLGEITPAEAESFCHSGTRGGGAGGNDSRHDPLLASKAQMTANAKKISTTSIDSSHQHRHHHRPSFKCGGRVHGSPLSPPSEAAATAGNDFVELPMNDNEWTGVGDLCRSCLKHPTATAPCAEIKPTPSNTFHSASLDGIADTAGHARRADSGLYAPTVAAQGTEQRRRLTAPSWASRTAATIHTHSIPSPEKSSSSGDSTQRYVLLGEDVDAEVLATVAVQAASNQGYAAPRGICRSISTSGLQAGEVSLANPAGPVGVPDCPPMVGGGDGWGMPRLSSTGASSTGTVSPRPSLSLWYTPNPTPPGKRRCSATGIDHYRAASIELQKMSADLRPVLKSGVPAGGW